MLIFWRAFVLLLTKSGLRRRISSCSWRSSMHATYCTQVLHLTEHAAYGRIEAVRAVRKFPVVLERLHAGTLSLTAVCLLGPHLTTENHLEILEEARHKSKREVEAMVARLRPTPDVPAAIRKLPDARRVVPPLTVPPPVLDVAPTVVQRVIDVRPLAELKPVAAERFKMQFTIGRETHEKLRRAQALLRHSIPSGDLEALFDRAITLLIGDAAKKKFAAIGKPKAAATAVSTSRCIPSAVKRAVWTRDGARCAFRGPCGRCSETGFLEFHHVVPFAAGGETSVGRRAVVTSRTILWTC